jgi:site-specific recombinase XerD
MMILSDYSKNKGITQRHSRKAEEFSWPESTLAEFDQFFQSSKFLSWSKSYQDNSVRQFKKFAAFLKEKGIISCDEITTRTLSEYYTDRLKNYTPPTIAVIFALFRAFFRFLYLTEAHPQDLSESLPSIRKTPPSLPHIWSGDDIDKVLNCIDRGNPTESRDYAIILLIVRLGLRISDVKNLKLDDIKWERNCIEVIQQKTKEPLVLPLLRDVGEAIIEYVRFHRPKTEKRNIFISHSAPFEPFAEHSHFHGQFTKYLTRAGINVSSDKAHGVHSLRHALAVKLIENNISLLTVKGILGHGDINSAANYLRVDVELLRQCALCPGGVY